MIRDLGYYKYMVDDRLSNKEDLIDTHCHLEMEQFAPDRDEVIKRAKEAGIGTMITIGSDLKGNTGGLELARKYDMIYCAVGFHPHDAKDFTEGIFDRVKAWAEFPRFQR